MVVGSQLGSGFEARLRKLANQLGVQVERGDGQLRVSMPDLQLEAVDRCVIDLTGEALCTSIAGMGATHDGPLGDDVAEASVLDFVAAWAAGAIGVRERWVGEVCVARELCFGVGGGPARVLAKDNAFVARGWSRWRRGETRWHRVAEPELAASPHRGAERPAWAPWLGWGGHAQALASEPKRIPVDGELDLHNFSPKEVGKVVRSYIAEARDAGVLQLRIVHGKGKGVLRRTVHAELARDPAVADFRLAGMGAGSWGATLVNLHPPHADEGADD